jgi:RNA polymerase subunit RPABC4/transcription elongation factor Spt4
MNLNMSLRGAQRRSNLNRANRRSLRRVLRPGKEGKGITMPDPQIDPGHNNLRNALRVAGPVIAATGLVLMIVGLVNFFMAFGGMEPPRLFWCAFVGIPLLGVGGILTSYAFLGRFMRYVAGETAPVGKDTFNYLAEGTREGVQAVAGAIGQGLRESHPGGATAPMVRCHKCNALLAADARFCSQCGQALGKTRPCPACGELNDPDARFCDNCGRTFAPPA